MAGAIVQPRKLGTPRFNNYPMLVMTLGHVLFC